LDKNSKISEVLFLDKIFPKGKKGFQFWTFFLSIFENPKKLFKKAFFLTCCDHNARKIIFGLEKSVTINFYIFKENDLGVF
jgi:hypothetical protein